MNKYEYDQFENAYLIEQYDSTDTTLVWSETKVYYSLIDNETYAIRIDQDGNEDLLWTEKGLVE